MWKVALQGCVQDGLSKRSQVDVGWKVLWWTVPGLVELDELVFQTPQPGFVAAEFSLPGRRYSSLLQPCIPLCCGRFAG